MESRSRRLTVAVMLLGTGVALAAMPAFSQDKNCRYTIYADGKHDDFAGLWAWSRGMAVTWAKDGKPVPPDIEGEFVIGGEWQAIFPRSTAMGLLMLGKPGQQYDHGSIGTLPLPKTAANEMQQWAMAHPLTVISPSNTFTIGPTAPPPPQPTFSPTTIRGEAHCTAACHGRQETRPDPECPIS